MIDLRHLSHYQENNRIEAKRAQGGLPESIWETYSAFANSFGGIILLGVTEGADKNFASVPLPDPERLAAAFWGLVNDRHQASANILKKQDVRVVPSDGNRIVVIEVPRADRHDKPVYIGEDPFAGTYRRDGEGDYHCSREEVLQMLRDREDRSADASVIAGLNAQALEEESVYRYREALAAVRPGYEQGADQAQLLTRIGALAADESGVMRPTAAGLLMLGREQEIRSVFPGHLLVYRRVFAPDGEFSPVSQEQESGGNLFDFYQRVSGQLACFITAWEKAAHTPPAGVDSVPFAKQAEEQMLAPALIAAVQEGLVNALVHADYTNRQGVWVEQRADQIIITNPGSLRVWRENLFSGGISDPRNELLSRMFRLIGAGRGEGKGLSRIHAAWQQRGLAAPQLSELFCPDRTRLTLSLRPGCQPYMQYDGNQAQLGAEEKKQRILEYLTRAVAAPAAKIARQTALPPQEVKQYLQQLREKKLIVASAETGEITYRLKA